MEQLRRLFGLREKDETLSIILVVILLFVVLFLLLRGCVGQVSSVAPVGLTLPSANTPLVDSSLENGNVQFTGNAAANARVDVFVDGKYIGTTSADTIGQWHLDGEVAESGRHTLSLKSKLADGTLYESAEFPFDLNFRGDSADESLSGQGSAVDYLPQLGTETEQVAIPAAPTIDTALANRTIQPGVVTLTGNGAPGQTLLVFANGAPIGLATVAANGTWRFRTAELTTGEYEFRAEDSTRDGFETDAFTVVVEDPVAKPTLALIRDLDRPTILPLSGTGQPNSDIEILLNGEPIATVPVDEDGNWQLDVERQSGVLDYSFVARNTVASGGEFSESFPGRIIFEREALAVTDPEPDPTPEPEPDEPEPIAASIEFDTPNVNSADLSYDAAGVNGPITFRGVGEPAGARVKVYLDGDEIGETTVTNSGDWEIAAGIANLAPGEYLATASIVDDAGGELASSGRRFVTIPESQTVSFNDIELDFAEFEFADDAASGPLNLSGAGGPVGSLVRVFLDGEELGEATIDEDGTWQLDTAIEGFAPGRYDLSVQLTDTNNLLLAETSSELVIPSATNTLSVTFAGDDDAQAKRIVDIAPAVELIFDASWSMTLPPGSDAEADRLTADDPNSRIAIARDSLLAVVNELPEGIPVALRAFGNRAAPLECQTELEVALQPLDRAALSAVIESIEPQFNANTHIAASLRAIPDDLADAEGAITVILLTDGQETCGGNPANAIAELRAAGIDVIVDVVGFAINNDQLKTQFESWAEIGGGQYFDASDSEGLAEALGEAFRPKFRVLDQDGTTVAIGAINGDSIELPIGAYTVEIIGDTETSYNIIIGAEPSTLEVE